MRCRTGDALRPAQRSDSKDSGGLSREEILDEGIEVAARPPVTSEGMFSLLF